MMQVKSARTICGGQTVSTERCTRLGIVHTFLFAEGKTTFILSCLAQWTSK